MSIVVNTNIGSERTAIACCVSNELSTAMERCLPARKLTAQATTLQVSPSLNDRTNPWLEHGDKKRERRLGYAFYD